MGWKIERFGCFGKLPVSREFLVDGARELSESHFDLWIGDGLGLGKARLGSRFDGLYDSFPLTRIHWPFPNGKRVLLGILGPSRDAAGRRHPFSVFALAEENAARLPGSAAPIEAAVVQEIAADRWRGAAGFSDAQAVLGAMRAPATIPPSEPALSAYRNFLNTTVADDLWAGLETGVGVARAEILQGLIDTVSLIAPTSTGAASTARKDVRGFRGGIRIPLRSHGSNGSTLMALWESAFWLDWIEVMLGRPLERVWWFWSAEGARPAFHLFLSEPSASQWSYLIDPKTDLESVSDLCQPYATSAPLKPALRDLLDSRSNTLQEYLRLAATTKGGLS